MVAVPWAMSSNTTRLAGLKVGGAMQTLRTCNWHLAMVIWCGRGALWIERINHAHAWAATCAALVALAGSEGLCPQ